MMTRWLASAFAVSFLAQPATSYADMTADNRVLITQFADQFYTHKDAHGAFQGYVAPDYIQHNPGLKDGREPAEAVLTPMFSTPGAQFDIKHVLIDGDFALIHLFGRGNPATLGAAVVDLYRLHAGQVVEHWDVIQPIVPGTDPLASAPVDAGHSDETAQNRVVMSRYIDTLFRQKQVVAAFQADVAPGLIEHNPSMKNGRDAVAASFTSLFADPGASFDVRHVLVDGDFAAVHYLGRLKANESGAAVVEIFRLKDGKIVEHWAVYQPIPNSSVNPHPMF